ncbi:MAG: YbgC/FadM family acyl-CoA thioesterase [Arenicella sp.]
MHRYEVRVFYEDTDAGGMVYYANYLKFMERARSELLRSYNWDIVRVQQELQTIFVVKHVEMDYVSPAALGDLLTVQTQIIKLGKVGMSLEQAIYNQETLICSGLVKLAALDSELFTLKAMSDDFLSAIVSP